MRYNPPVDCPVEQKDGNVFWTFDLVEERLIEAVGFLDRHVRSGRYPFAGDGPWNLVVRDNRAAAQSADDMADHVEPESDVQVRRRTGLRSAEVDRMDEALAWIELLPVRGETRKLVHDVCLLKGREGKRVSWRDVKARMRSRQTPDLLKMTYRRAIAKIAQALSR